MTGTFQQFAVVLLQTILVYMLAGLVFPDFFGESVVDLKESFYTHRGWFFSFGFAAIASSVCKDVVLDGKLPHPTNLAFHVIFGSTLLIGALTRRDGITRHWLYSESPFSFSTSSCSLRGCIDLA
jgi:hypothetical protein